MNMNFDKISTKHACTCAWLGNELLTCSCLYYKNDKIELYT